MMEGLLVKCDNCQEDFRIRITVKIVDPGVEQHGFRCPDCGKRYVAFYRTKPIRRKLADVAKLKIKASKERDAVKRDALLVKALELQKKAAQDMDALKEKYGG